MYHPLGQGVRAPAMEQPGSHPARSLRRLRVPLRPLCLLRVMGVRLPNRLPPVGFLLVLLPLAQLVTPVRRRSRRPVMRRAMSPSETLHLLVWLTSFMRSARMLVRFRTLSVRRAAGLRLGSASQSLRTPDSASGFIPESWR